MRALIVSDIHSNLEAFQAVLGDAENRGGFDQIWSLGDLVGYGPDPGPCVDLIRQHDGVAVAGNHDLAAVGKLGTEAFNDYAAAAVHWTAEQLGEEQKSYLRALPLKTEVDNFTLAHGSPRDPVWEYVVTPQSAAANFRYFRTDRCLVGHSHIPFICRPRDDTAVFGPFPLDEAVPLGPGRVIVNPGGLGQPRDGDPRATYAVYDADAGAVYHHRVEYDIPKTQEKIVERGLPMFLALRLAGGR